MEEQIIPEEISNNKEDKKSFFSKVITFLNKNYSIIFFLLGLIAMIIAVIIAQQNSECLFDPYNLSNLNLSNINLD